MRPDSTSSPFAAEDIAPRLISEFGYRPGAADRVAQRLTRIDPEIRQAFWRWWQTGALEPSVEVAGYTAERLMREFGLNPVAAFSTLDGLKVDAPMMLDTLRRRFDRPMPPLRRS